MIVINSWRSLPSFVLFEKPSESELLAHTKITKKPIKNLVNFIFIEKSCYVRRKTSTKIKIVRKWLTEKNYCSTSNKAKLVYVKTRIN